MSIIVLTLNVNPIYGTNLEIQFLSDKLRDLMNSQKDLQKQYGQAGFKRIGQRLSDLQAAENLEEMRQLPGKCHELKGDRAGQLSVRLHGGYRLIFEPANDPVPYKDDGGLDWTKVTNIRILEIEDYHHG
jgi:proteic killer suppression protein